MKLGMVRPTLYSAGLIALLVLVLSAISWADSGTEKILYNFTSGSDGNHPQGRLIFDKSGNLYGTTSPHGSLGGTCTGGGCRTVFKLSLINGHWVENIIYTFCSVAPCADGESPQAGGIFDSAGNLYGTTKFGGDPTCGCGTVFELTPSAGSWTFHVLHTFTGQPDGQFPVGGVTLDSKGRVHGTTVYGGANSEGTVFPLINAAGAWTETILHSFPSSGNRWDFPRRPTRY